MTGKNIKVSLPDSKVSNVFPDKREESGFLAAAQDDKPH